MVEVLIWGDRNLDIQFNFDGSISGIFFFLFSWRPQLGQKLKSARPQFKSFPGLIIWLIFIMVYKFSVATSFSGKL